MFGSIKSFFIIFMIHSNTTWNIDSIQYFEYWLTQSNTSYIDSIQTLKFDSIFWGERGQQERE